MAAEILGDGEAHVVQYFSLGVLDEGSYTFSCYTYSSENGNSFLADSFVGSLSVGNGN